MQGSDFNPWATVGVEHEDPRPEIEQEAQAGAVESMQEQAADAALDVERERRRSFLMGRQRGIGSSDIHRILTGDAMEVYYEKTRPITDVDVDEGRDKIDLMRGNLLEPIAAALFWKLTGRAGRRERRQFFHPEYPGAMTSADGTQFGNSPNLPAFAQGTGGLEIKAPRAKVVQELIDHGTRESIILQGQHSVAVRRQEWGTLAFCTLEHSDGPIVPVDIPADKQLGTFLLEVSARFWIECVVPRVPPAPAEWAQLLEKAPPIREAGGKVVVLDPGGDRPLTELIRIFILLTKQRKAIEEQRDRASLELDDALREAYPLADKFQAPGVGKIARVVQQRSTLQAALLKQAKPIDRDAFVRWMRILNESQGLPPECDCERIADELALDVDRFMKQGERFSYLLPTPAKEEA